MSSPCDAREELFDELFARLHKMAFSWLLGQTGSRESAEDVLQDTFVRVWAHIADANSRSADAQRAWVLAIAKNALNDFRRRSAVRPHLRAVSLDESISAREEDAAAGAIRREETDLLQRAIDALPIGLRTVLTMTVVGEMSSEEIGAALGKPAGTIRSQLYDARKRLAKRMGIS